MEFSGDQEQFFDFCLWPYRPIAPYTNKYTSANLLFHSFETMRTPDRIYALVQAIREGFGVSRTVWGIKQAEGIISWEFYFYDYRRVERKRSISKLLQIVEPQLACEINVNENFHYFMFSIDIDNDLFSKSGEIEEIHMYIGNPGSTVSSGICYALTRQATRLENFYFFFDTQKESIDIMNKIACSAHIEASAISIDQILWPQLKNCSVTVVANKQHSDAVYFSRIDIDQLIYFLKRMKYPVETIAFTEENRSRLDHMQYDVGFDYKMEGRDLVILKSAYYGLF